MVLVVAEHQSGALNRTSIEAVAAAQLLGEPITVVLPGADLEALGLELAALDVGEVVRLEDEQLRTYTSDGYVAALASFVRAIAPRIVVLPHTYQSRDFAPRLAARLNRPLLADCMSVRLQDGTAVFTRPMFQGKVHADVVTEGPAPHLVTFQAGAYRSDAARQAASPAPVRLECADIPAGSIRQTPDVPFREARQSVDLTQAARLVSIGRGIKEQQHVALAERLASALGAELAASRPICDAGWLAMDRQVGSSGQTVAPRLYLALGISGAIQHIVGMKGAKTIVAINRDADAPIFEVANLGIVGDLFDVVPAMLAALETT